MPEDLELHKVAGYEGEALYTYGPHNPGYRPGTEVGVATVDDWYIVQYNVDEDDRSNLWWYPIHQEMEWFEFDVHLNAISFTVVVDLSQRTLNRNMDNIFQMINAPWVMV